MFTGLIESTAIIVSSRQKVDVREISIDGVSFASDLNIGDSVAVSGVCLTVTRADAGGFAVEMMSETCGNTVLGSAPAGYRVNLERSMRASGRFEGHIVTGHVDTVGRVSNIIKQGRSREVRIEIDPAFGKYVARKGSIAVQGVSLTVMDAGNGFLGIGLIPKTLETTTMNDLAAGSMVNIEFDIVSKYIEALLSGKSGEMGKPLTMERLGEMGWV
ncbi:MAG: riboflavin synthase [Thermovirgaceae bacterium]|nr:riboflavin synthase [Thermovirgaceae bacterium]